MKMTHTGLTSEVVKTIRYNLWKKHTILPSNEAGCRDLIAIMNASQQQQIPPEVLYPVYLNHYEGLVQVQHLETLATYFGFDCWKKCLAENRKVITAVIVDDEAPSRDNLEAILKTFCDKILVVAKATTLSEARQAILDYTPDLVLLDIHLGHESGLDLLQLLPDSDIEVMFVTAFKDYNAKPILERPYEYILKPVDLDMLNDAIERVRVRVFER